MNWKVLYKEMCLIFELKNKCFLNMLLKNHQINKSTLQNEIIQIDFVQEALDKFAKNNNYYVLLEMNH